MKVMKQSLLLILLRSDALHLQLQSNFILALMLFCSKQSQRLYLPNCHKICTLWCSKQWHQSLSIFPTKTQFSLCSAHVSEHNGVKSILIPFYAPTFFTRFLQFTFKAKFMQISIWVFPPLSFSYIKFIYSEKTTKFCEIFPLLLTAVH